MEQTVVLRAETRCLHPRQHVFTTEAADLPALVADIKHDLTVLLGKTPTCHDYTVRPLEWLWNDLVVATSSITTLKETP